MDDKIIKKAEDAGSSAELISKKYIENYFEDFDALNIKRATQHPKATEHISDMINLISDLIAKNIAYTTKNGVYFSVSKFSDYGKLSKKNVEELESGARIEVDESKDSPLDFALWKFSDSEPSWNSPWGNGRPGWHIECSAMSIKYLGENFDIHGGGRDLIFPHHENEIAQSESFTGKPFAKIWMHAGMITINGEKMSKSRGTFIKARTYLDHLDPEYLRYYFAYKSSAGVDDFDLDTEDFQNRINADLIGKWINIASRSSKIIREHFENCLSENVDHEDIDVFLLLDYR